jgi:hypothetical protein
MRIRRPSPATVISIVALVVALGGTSYAALKLPAGSVGTKQLKANAVTGAKVKNGSLAASDFGGNLPQGAKGEKGDKGEPGTPGGNGTDGNDGTPGANGAALVAHARCFSIGGACPISSNHTNTNVPLAGLDTWTMAMSDAAQVDIKIAWQPAVTCTGGTGSQVTVEDNNTAIATFQSAPSANPLSSEKSLHLFPPNATSHALTVHVADNCTGAGQSEQGIVGDVKIDAVRFIP